MSFITSNSIVQQISHTLLNNHNVELFIKRDDLIHTEVSGNKWRKLKYNIEQFRRSKKNHILTFGGAFSNHLLATASACQQNGISSIGIVRGEELTNETNHILKRCTELGMRLVFISRMEYGMRSDKEYLEELSLEYPNSFIIPEGGANYLGVIGCQEIMNEIDRDIDEVFVAQGTSTTSCGLLLSNKTKSLHVVPALKGYDSISEMTQLLARTGVERELIDDLMTKVIVHENAHFGGYAKVNEDLIQFIETMENEMNLPLDKVYTAKAFFALMTELESGRLDGKKVLFIHTGGLFGTMNELIN